MTSSFTLGSIQVENNRKSYHFLGIRYGDNFGMIITERRPKLKLENVLSKKICNLLSVLAKIILRTPQQYCYHGNS